MPRTSSVQSHRQCGMRRTAIRGETTREVQVLYNTSSTCDSKTCATTDGEDDKVCASDQLEEAGLSSRPAIVRQSHNDELPLSPHRTSAARRAKEGEQDESSLLLGALPLSIAGAEEVEDGVIDGPVHDSPLFTHSQANAGTEGRGGMAALPADGELILTSSPACSPPHASATSTHRATRDANGEGGGPAHTTPPAAAPLPKRSPTRTDTSTSREGKTQNAATTALVRTPTRQNVDSTAPLFIDDETPLLPARVTVAAAGQATTDNVFLRQQRACLTSSLPCPACEECVSSEDSEVVIEEAPHTPSSTMLFAPAHTAAAQDGRARTQRLMPGMSVEARWGGRWFAAIVTEAEHNGYVQIRWTADGSFLHLKRREVRLPRAEEEVPERVRCDTLNDDKRDGEDDGELLRRNASCVRPEVQPAACGQLVNRVLDDDEGEDSSDNDVQTLTDRTPCGHCVQALSPVMTATQLVAMMEAEDAEEAQGTCAVKALTMRTNDDGRAARRPRTARGDHAPLPPRKRVRGAASRDMDDQPRRTDVVQEVTADANVPHETVPSVCARRLVLWSSPAARDAMHASGAPQRAAWQRGLSRLVCDGAVVTDSLAHFDMLVSEALSQSIVERVFLCLVPPPTATTNAITAPQAEKLATEEWVSALHFADAIGVHAVSLAWLCVLAEGAGAYEEDSQTGVTYRYPASYIVQENTDRVDTTPYVPLAVAERFLHGKTVYMAADDDAMERLVRLAGARVQRGAVGLQSRAPTVQPAALPDYCYLPPGRRVKVRPDFGAVALLEATWLWHALAEHRTRVMRRPYTTALASLPASLKRETSQGIITTGVHPTQGMPSSLQYTQLAFAPMSREQAEDEGTAKAAIAAMRESARCEAADAGLISEVTAARRGAPSPSVHPRHSPPRDAAPAVDLVAAESATPPLPPVVEGEDYYFYLPSEENLLVQRAGDRSAGSAPHVAPTLALGRVVTVSASPSSLSTPLVTLRCYEVKGMTLRHSGGTGEVERQLTVFLGRREVTVPARLLLFDTPVYVISAAELRHVYILDEADTPAEQPQESPSSLEWMRTTVRPTTIAQPALGATAGDSDTDDEAERRREKERQQQLLLLQEATTVPVPRSSGSTTCDSDGLSEFERDMDVSGHNPQRPTSTANAIDEAVAATPLGATQYALLGDDAAEGRPRVPHHRFDTASTAVFTPREGSVVEEVQVGAMGVREGAVVCFRDHYCLAQSGSHFGTTTTTTTSAVAGRVAGAQTPVASASQDGHVTMAEANGRRLRWGKVQMMRRIHRSVALVVHIAAENSVFGGSKMCVITPDMIVDVLPPQREDQLTSR